MKRLSITCLFFVGLLVLWQLCCLMGMWPAFLFPPPEAVGDYLWVNVCDGTLLDASWVTLRRLVSGYGIGILIGIPLGMIMSRSTFVKDTLGFLSLGLQALPSVCWVPLATLWFGQTESAMLFVVVMGTLWSVILATDNGMRTVPPIYARAARTMGASPLKTLVYVTLPASAPFVVSGMKQGWAFAWRSLMAAEIFVPILTGFGLGQLLHFGRELNSMDQVLGIMFIIVVIGLLSDKILFSPVERFLHSRWGTNKG
ncbi:MAG: ABC transporter permease [Akkermansia sp.]